MMVIRKRYYNETFQIVLTFVGRIKKLIKRKKEKKKRKDVSKSEILCRYGAEIFVKF